MEGAVVDQIVQADGAEERLELCRYLRALRSLRRGTVTFGSQKRAKELGGA